MKTVSPKTDHIIIANLHMTVWQNKKSGLSVDEASTAMNNAAAQVRNNFYDHSIPWKENGDRLMTTWIFPDFYEQHKVLCLKLTEWKRDFKEAYLAAVDRMEFNLVEDYNPEDFPSWKEVASKFTLIFNLDRISQPLRPGEIETGEDTVELFNENLDQRFAAADTALRDKLRKPLENFIEGFSRPKNFYESHLVTITETADTVRKLNFSGDERLTEICETLKQDVGAMSIKDLRANKEMRELAVTSVRRILQNLS
jgi:hypothetical protein